MKTIFSVLDTQSASFIWRLTLTSAVVLSFCQVFWGDTVYVEPFFLLPIIIASWYGSRKSGLALAMISVILLTGIKSFQVGFSLTTLLGYAIPFAVSFFVLATLIRDFRSVHRFESEAADTDFLTGISNSRGFYVELADELVRASRYKHVFSLAYIDIDHFKTVNDTLGHAEGDRLLVRLAACLKESLRATDTVARLGGDEFACILPETEITEARQAILKTRDRLAALMKKNKWPVSFSIGFVTFEKMPADIKEAVKVADDLMYTVKNKQKNNIAYVVWGDEDS